MNYDIEYLRKLMDELSDNSWYSQISEDDGETTSDTSSSTGGGGGTWKQPTKRKLGKTYMGPKYKWESGRVMGKTYSGPGYKWESGVTRGEANPLESVTSKKVITEQDTFYYDANGNLQGGGPITIPKNVRMASSLYPGKKADGSEYPKKIDPTLSLSTPLPSFFGSQPVSYWKGKPVPKKPTEYNGQIMSSPGTTLPRQPWSYYNDKLMNRGEANQMYQTDMQNWATVNFGPKPTPPLSITQNEWLRKRVDTYVNYLDYLKDLETAEKNSPYQGGSNLVPSNELWQLQRIGPYMKALHDWKMKAEPSYATNYNLRIELENRRKLAAAEIKNQSGGDNQTIQSRFQPSVEAQRDATATPGFLNNIQNNLYSTILNKYNIPELEGLVDTTEKRQALEDDEDWHFYMALLSVGVALFAPPLLGLTTSQAFFAASAIDAVEGLAYWNNGDKTKAGESWLISGLAAIPELRALSKINGTVVNSAARLANNAISTGTDFVLSPSLKASLRTGYNNLSNLAQSAPVVRQAMINAAPAVVKPALRAVTSDPALMIGGIYLAMQGYEAAAERFKNTSPSSTAKSFGIDWLSAKQAFMSTGSVEDNLMLKTAILKGWKPGDPVPEELQTQLYKDIIVKKQEEINQKTQQREAEEKQKQEQLKQKQERIKNNQLTKEDTKEITHSNYKDSDGNEIPPEEMGKKVNLGGFKEFLKNKGKDTI